MPTSVAHSIAGYAALDARNPTRPLRRPLFWFLVLVVANAPDLDFVPGLLVGEPGAFHRGASHSLGAALVAGIVLAPLFGRSASGLRRGFVVVFLVYASHALLDVVGTAPMNVRGVPILWPLSGERYLFRVPLLSSFEALRSFERGSETIGFFASIASWRGLQVFVLDAVLFLPLLLVGPAARWLRTLGDPEAEPTRRERSPERAGPSPEPELSGH